MREEKISTLLFIQIALDAHFRGLLERSIYQLDLREAAVVLHVDGSLEHRHLLGIEILPQRLVGEEQHAVGVMGEGADAAGVEVGQQGHCHTFVHVDVPEGDGPPCTVGGADGNLVALADAGIVEEYAELLCLGGHVGIGERRALIVAECVLAPLLSDGVLELFQVMFHG